MSLFTKKQFNIANRRLAARSLQNQASTSADIFQRNRTLTGTTSNNLNNIDAKSDLESSRSHAHHLSNKRRRVMSIMVVVFLSAALLWAIISNFTASVVIRLPDTTISKTVDTTNYRNAIKEYLNTSPIGRLSFLLDQSALNNYVINKLPEVASVAQQKMVNIGETSFVVTMRKPVAGWKINDKQYYVDAKGISFEQNYFPDPAVQIIDDNGISSQTGTAIASNRFLSFVGRVVDLARANGYTVIQAIIPAETTRELEIRLKEGDYLVKLSIDRPAGEQVEDMGVALSYFNEHGQKPEYIDVRVSSRAFYK